MVWWWIHSFLDCWQFKHWRYVNKKTIRPGKLVLYLKSTPLLNFVHLYTNIRSTLCIYAYNIWHVQWRKFSRLPKRLCVTYHKRSYLYLYTVKRCARMRYHGGKWRRKKLLKFRSIAANVEWLNITTYKFCLKKISV